MANDETEVSASVVAVFGVGRSGTSLLQCMLHSHPRISFLPEIHFFKKYVGPPFQRRLWKLRGPDAFRRELAEDQEFARCDVSVSSVMRAFDGAEVIKFSPVVAFSRLLALHKEKSGTGTMVGIKDPRLIDFLPEMYKYFPSAKCVHIIRDPRDVVLSRREAEWSSSSHLVNALIYRSQIDRARRAKADNGCQMKYYEIQYERLVSNPGYELSALCDYLGLSYTDRMLDFNDAARDVVDSAAEPWKKETFGPLKSDNYGKWRREFGQEEVRMIEAICLGRGTDLPYNRQEDAPKSLYGRAKEFVFGSMASAISATYGLRRLIR